MTENNHKDVPREKVDAFLKELESCKKMHEYNGFLINRISIDKVIEMAHKYFDN